jgi:hypothetical protein
MESITDRIYSAMREGEKTLSNAQILKEFFKIDSPDDEISRKIVEPILGGDARFSQSADRSWKALKTVSIEDLPVHEISFVLFAIEDPAKSAKKFDARGKDVFSFLEPLSSFVRYRGGIIEKDLDIKTVIQDVRRSVFVPHDVRSMGILKKVCRVHSPLRPELRTLSVRALVSVLFPDKTLKTWESIVEQFGIRNIQSDRPSSKTETLVYILEYILRVGKERGISTFGELFQFSMGNRKDVDFSRYGFDKDFLKDIPETPGVYQFFNRKNEMIYVGKTNNLRIRVHSYFWNTGESLEKIEAILEELFTIQYRALGSDLEAMIEEFRLIEMHRPKYNKRVNVPERKIPVSDRILLLPGKEQSTLKLYFISENSLLMENDFDCVKPNEAAVVEIIEEMRGGARRGFDPLQVIAVSYMKRYEERINIVEIDQYRSVQDVLAALRLHCTELSGLMKEKRRYVM